MSSNVPPALATIVRRCLEKRTGERFQSALDLAFSLEALTDSTISTGTAAAIRGVAEPRRRPGLAWMTGLVLLGLVVGATAAVLLRPRPGSAEPATFQLLSSRRGTVTNAGFAPGGESALYSASWEGGPLRVYSATPGTRTSDPLSIGEADLLSVSSTGELALSLDRRYPLGFERIGTLAVAKPGGSAPRPVLEDVLVADWAPDGQSLAVAHEVDGVVRLEYPIGTVLYESSGWISYLRVHPDGDRILFADNPARGDNYAVAKIIDGEGRVEIVGDGASWGLLWAPDGESVLFANGRTIFAARAGEEPRRIHSAPTSMRLLDIDAAGRVLMAVASSRREMIVRAPGADEDRNLSWLDWSTPWLISADGRNVVFEEGNLVTDEGYAIFMRGTDGSAPLLLGHGSVMALSPDGRWIAMVKRAFGDEAELQLVPTGPGEPVSVDVGELQVLPRSGTWIAAASPDDRGALLFAGRETDSGVRLYHLLLTDGAVPRAITPPDLAVATVGHAVSIDGTRLVVKPAEGPAVQFSIEGGDPLPVPGIEASDLPLRFDGDGRHLFVRASSAVPAPIVRIDLATGERSLWRELSPIDPAGVSAVDKVQVSADGAAHVYSNRRVITWLVLAEGLL